MAGTGSPWIIDVAEENFNALVIDQSFQKPVVVDFWSPSCGPCRVLGPMLEKLTNEQQGAVVLAKVNVDECQELAGYFQIEGIPAVMGFKNGQPVLVFTGAQPEATVREFFTRLGPVRVDPLLLRAQALEDTKPAAAEKLYRDYLEKDSASEEARVGLARVLIAQNKEGVTELLDSIDAGSPLAEEVQRLRGVLSLRDLSAGASGDEAALRKQIAADPKAAQPRYELGCALAKKGKHEEALEMLLAAGERDMKLAAGPVREAMVQIFYALGPSHPLSDRYRAQLARLLY